MPIKRYATNYRNEIQQLLVLVSRNYYVTKDGRLKYQKKSFDYDLRNVFKSAKTHVVHFIVRDHYSGLYYAEMCRHNRLINLGAFLYRAWSKKKDIHFFGIPEHLFVPQTVIQKWPGIKKICKGYGIPLHKPKSGFEAGSIAVKNWQNTVYNWLTLRKEPDFDRLHDHQALLCQMAESRDKIKKWFSVDTKVFVPSQKEDLTTFFTPSKK